MTHRITTRLNGQLTGRNIAWSTESSLIKKLKFWKANAGKRLSGMPNLIDGESFEILSNEDYLKIDNTRRESARQAFIENEVSAAWNGEKA